MSSVVVSEGNIGKVDRRERGKGVGGEWVTGGGRQEGSIRRSIGGEGVVWSSGIAGEGKVRVGRCDRGWFGDW